MPALARKLLVCVVALWLPLCCCQVIALASAGGTCCAGDRVSEPAEHCCCSTADECDSQGDRHDAPIPAPCTHCVEKAPPPAGISLDSFFVACAIPFEFVLVPSQVDPTMTHADEAAGWWDSPPPDAPPQLPTDASLRCSFLALWLI